MNRVLARARELASELERHTPSRTRGIDFSPIGGARVRDLDRARILALARDVARVRDRVRGEARDLWILMDNLDDPDYERDYDDARDKADFLGRADHMSTELVGLLVELAAGSARARQTAGAGWLVGLAVRVVPAEDRARYGEEWRGELWDLAKGAGWRRRQMVHAAKTLAHAWSVREGVREGRRRPAGGG